jgi:hypothetical protein
VSNSTPFASARAACSRSHHAADLIALLAALAAKALNCGAVRITWKKLSGNPARR